MAKIIISREERLPTLEVLDKQYTYDVSDTAVIDRLRELIDELPKSVDDTVERCKQVITLLLCGNPEPAERIAEVYGGSAGLWLDAVAQFTPYIQHPVVKAQQEQAAALKELAARAR